MQNDSYFSIAIDFNLITLWCKALGTKRLASEELVSDWDNKRLNVGPVRILFLFSIYKASLMFYNNV